MSAQGIIYLSTPKSPEQARSIRQLTEESIRGEKMDFLILDEIQDVCWEALADLGRRQTPGSNVEPNR